jgi:hypothetical protein
MVILSCVTFLPGERYVNQSSSMQQVRLEREGVCGFTLQSDRSDHKSCCLEALVYTHLYPGKLQVGYL